MNQSALYISLAFLVNIITIAGVCLKYKVIAGFAREKIKFVNAVNIILVAQVAGFALPFKIGSLLSKPFAIRHYNPEISIKKASLITLLEQFIEFGVQLIVLFILIVLIGSKVMLNKYLIFLIAAGALLIILLVFYRRVLLLLWKMRKFLPKSIRKRYKLDAIGEEKVKYYLGVMHSYLLNRKMLLALLPLILAHIFIVPLLIYFLGNSYAEISYSSSFIAYWISMTLGKISGIPAGLGARDVSLGGYLSIIGMPSPAILFVVFAYRAMATFFPIAIGVPVLLKMGKNKLEKYYNDKKNGR